MSLAQVRWIASALTQDERGSLSAFDEPELPFPIRRFFYMHRVPQGQERGGHAHRDTQQCVLAIAGRFMMDVSDGKDSATYALDDPDRALYVPSMTWVRRCAWWLRAPNRSHCMSSRATRRSPMRFAIRCPRAPCVSTTR